MTALNDLTSEYRGEKKTEVSIILSSLGRSGLLYKRSDMVRFPSALNFSYSSFSMYDMYPIISTDALIFPVSVVLSSGITSFNEARSRLHLRLPFTIISLSGVLTFNVRSTGLPPSSTWNLLTSSVELSICTPS